MRFNLEWRFNTKISVLPWIAFFYCFSCFAQNSEFDKGLDAYSQGDYSTALEMWKPLAESGSKEAAFNLGVLYEQGLGVKADFSKAHEWYRQAASAGYADAQFNLGSAYYHGQGVKQDIHTAISWWLRATEQEHPRALYNLATLYSRGEGVDKDLAKAMELYQRAASVGDTRAREVIEEIKQQPAEQTDTQTSVQNVGQNWLEKQDPGHWTVQLFAFAELESALEFARSKELSDEVIIYQAEVGGKTWFKAVEGSYSTRDVAEQAKVEFTERLPKQKPWIRRMQGVQSEAIEIIVIPSQSPNVESQESSRTDVQDELDDQNQSSVIQEIDKRDTDETEDDQTSSGAQDLDINTALYKGQQAFNLQNYADAFSYWRPLAEKGVAEAQYGVGFMYESGWGVARDYDQAFRWYQLAAQQGHRKSQFNLGLLYRKGEGVVKNDALGFYWIQTAADQGDERAQEYLRNER